MFKLHTKDGQTASVDLADADQAREWLPRLARDEAQVSVTGVTILSTHGYQVNVPRSEGFSHQFVTLEQQPPNGHRGFERVTVFAGDVRLVVTSHADSPAVRVSLARIGRMRFNPNRR